MRLADSNSSIGFFFGDEARMLQEGKARAVRHHLDS